MLTLAFGIVACFCVVVVLLHRLGGKFKLDGRFDGQIVGDGSCCFRCRCAVLSLRYCVCCIFHLLTRMFPFLLPFDLTFYHARRLRVAAAGAGDITLRIL